MKYDSDIVQSNIKEIFDQHNLEDYKQGSRWYKEANGFSIELANKYDIPPFRVAGIISAISPRKHWDDNKKLAEKVIRLSYPRGHWYTQIYKARKIKNASTVEEVDEILNGPKTVNFFHNIYDPVDQSFITIDRHISMITIGKVKSKFTPKQYNFLKEEIIKFATKEGIKPVTLQAMLWCTYKRVKGVI